MVLYWYLRSLAFIGLGLVAACILITAYALGRFAGMVVK